MNNGQWTRLAFCLLAALGACRPAGTLPPDVFPPAVADVWRRTQMRETPVSEAPDPVPRNSVDRVGTAHYEGPGKIDVRVYVLESAAVGLDLAQRWRPSSDTVFFNRGRYFVVVKWQEADRGALHEFVRALEMRLGPRS